MQITGGAQINGGYISGFVAQTLPYTSSPSGTEPGPINAYYFRTLYKVIYTQAELNDAGLSGSTNITGLMLYVLSVPNPMTPSVTIGLINTGAGVGSDITSGWTTVFSGSYPTPTVNTASNPVYSVRFKFTTPFTWNGSSNLGIGFAESARNSWTAAGTVATCFIGTGAFARVDSPGAYALTDPASSISTGRAICYLLKD